MLSVPRGVRRATVSNSILLQTGKAEGVEVRALETPICLARNSFGSLCLGEDASHFPERGKCLLRRYGSLVSGWEWLGMVSAPIPWERLGYGCPCQTLSYGSAGSCCIADEGLSFACRVIRETRFGVRDLLIYDQLYPLRGGTNHVLRPTYLHKGPFVLEGAVFHATIIIAVVVIIYYYRCSF